MKRLLFEGRVARRLQTLLVVLAVVDLVAAAPDPNRDLVRHTAEIAAQNAASEQTRAAQADTVRLAAQRVTAAARLRETEMAMATALARLDALARGRTQTENRLAERGADLMPLLPLIERLSLFPAETLLAVPATPVDAVRGVLVLKGLTQDIARDAAAVQRDQIQLEALTRDEQEAARLLEAAKAAQADQAQALDQQITEAQRVMEAASDSASAAEASAARHAADHAANASTLHNAIVTIEAEHQADTVHAQDEAVRAQQQRRANDAADAKRRAAALAIPAGPGLAEPNGQLITPVVGTLSRGFGEATEAGPANGLSFRAPPNARVSSPCAGRIVFAGPFRSFGLLLIIDCGGGYHFVLAGLARLDVQVGVPVQAGEPVGVMSNWAPGSVGERPTLYMELRHGGVPVNPGPWLNAKS